ncbi:MAG: serine/threonine-protein kinase [Dokdonella sp.]
MAERLTIGALADAFEQLVDLAQADRDAWIDEQIHDPRDRARLRRMLEADGNERHRFFDAPALTHAQVLREDEVAAVDLDQLIGQHFGPFRIERLIGQGGMAVVFAARRMGVDFEQTVAVKLLRRGLFSAVEQNLFRRERQLLAGLAHPNIARLIDGGISDAGIPYLVMEYVDGVRLDEFVETNQLDVRARLELFVRAAGAVEAAHRALVVHRDIKPSNILVSADGTPKLLDFGVAKLLDEDAVHQTMTTALTPSYAAPEQLNGEAITTATDVYALGVVLHELLTGERPSGADMRAPSTSVMRASTTPARSLPASPEQLRRLLRGDLDTIVQRALHQRPDLRYASATALIEDIQRHLDGRPVLAHPPSRLYVLGKLLRRHRIAAAFASALLLAIVGSVAGVLWQARKTHAEAIRANAVRDLLINVFRTAEQDRPQGERVKPEEVVDYGMRRVLDDATLPEQSRLELVGVLATVASSMGASAQMDALSLKGVELADRLYGPNDEQWIDARRRRAEALIRLDRAGEAAALLAPSQDAWMRSGTRAAYEALLTFALARGAAAQAGDAEANTDLLRQLRERAEADVNLSHDLMFDIMTSEADCLAAIHRFREALERGKAAERYWREQGLAPTGRMLWLYGAIGNAASSLGDSVEGEAAYRSAISLSERIHDGPHQDTAWFIGLLGSYLVALGRLEDAEPYVVNGLAMRRELIGESASQTLFAVNALSRLRAAQGRMRESFEALDEGIAACSRNSIENDACAGLLQTRGRAHLQADDIPAARADIEAGIAMQTKVAGADSPKVASQLAYLSDVLRREGRYQESVAIAEKSLSLMERSGGGHWTNIAVARLQRAWSNLHLGNAQQAFDEMADEEPRFAETSALNVRTRAQMKNVATLALLQLGRFEECRQWARSALALDPSADRIDAQLRTELQSIADSDDAKLARKR